MPESPGLPLFTVADVPNVRLIGYRTPGDPADAGEMPASAIAQAAALGAGEIGEETGTTYSAVAADFGATKEFNNALAIALTIPVDLDVATNTVFEIHQTGAGPVTIAGASGVTVQSEGGKLTTRGQYAIAGIKRVAANVYRVTGNVTA